MTTVVRCWLSNALKIFLRFYPPPLSTLISSPFAPFLYSSLFCCPSPLCFFNRCWCLEEVSAGGERCLRPAPIRAEYTVSAEPKQFIYLPEWLDPLLQKADCRFEGKSKVLFCAPIDVPFPPHQCSVKVLGTQCLQVCLTDFDKVLARTRASARAWVSQGDSLWFFLLHPQD